MKIMRYDYCDGGMQEVESDGIYVKYDDIKYLFKLQKECTKLQDRVELLKGELGSIYEICSPHYERD